MTNAKNTKRALWMSVLSLLLCFTMLLGTTYAWFTDSVASANNVIKSGNLDIELEYWDGDSWEDVKGKSDILTNTLWEPGVTEVAYLRVANAGSLALKYQLGINIVSETAGVNVAGETFKLSDYIQFGVVEGISVNDDTNAPFTYANREAAVAALTATEKISAGYTKAEAMTAGQELYLALVVYMPTTVGNEANHNGTNVPEINLGINVVATQMTAENDSFNDQYDVDAPYQVFVESAEELLSALETAEPGVEIVLSDDVTVTEPIVIPAAETATYSLRSVPAYTIIDLNGKSLNAALVEGSTTNHVYAFTNNGNLLLKNGTVNARGIFNYGNMVVEDATINAIDGNGGYAVRNYAGSTFIMNSGKLATTLEDDHLVNKGGYDATTLRVDEGAYAEINGGIIDNICDYTFAIDNAGEVVVNGGTIKSVHSTVSTYGTLTINGGSFTCNGIEGITAHALVAWDGSETVINGGSFDGKDNYNGFNVDAAAGADVVINGGNFLPVHSGSLYGEGTITVYGGVFFDEVKADRLARGCEAVQTEDGKWTIVATTVFVNNAEDLANATAGMTIVIESDITLTEEVTLPANVTLNGNGKQINGTIYAGGNLTIEGHVKVTAFSASYYNRVITIGPGACLEITGSDDRVSLAYGNVFNITGTIENAKTADKSSIQPSLIIPGGISITGGSDATFNVKNAYVVIGSTTSKNSAANGTFTFDFDNAIVEFTSQFTLSEPTGGKTPTFNMNVKDSVVTTGTKFIVAAPNSTVVLDNSTLTAATYFRNSGEVTLKNGSVLTASTIQFGENGGNDGTTVVDNSTLTITASSAGHALDGKGTGKIIAKNGATVSVTYYKGIEIECDESSTFTGTKVN